MIRVILPYHLQNLAQVGREVHIPPEGVTTCESLLDVLEETYPVLHGTIRDPQTQQRRPFLRFFACGQDLSHDPVDVLLPLAVLLAEEPFRIVGAMAGG